MRDKLREKALGEYHQAITDLHTHLRTVNRFPHEGQFPVLRALFQDHKKVVVGQCGRSHGKTEENLYIGWRFALTHPRSETIIVCPQKLQASQIYWIPRRLQNYGPQEYVAEARTSELRLVFKNGAYIYLAGCENYDSLRGIKPDLCIYDEVQHHTAQFDEEVMQPNLSSGKVCLVAMGTPPKRHCHYVDFRQNVLDHIAGGDPDYFYVELPSCANPILSPEWLVKKRQELINKGKYNVWQREYEGKMVFDTESAVFPFFSKTHRIPSSQMEQVLSRDRKHLRYFAIFDPGTTTVFAVLFAAINPYTNQLYILDEIYSTRKDQMTANWIWENAKFKMDAICDDEDKWLCYYDEAAAWFRNELSWNAPLIPTKKHKMISQQTADEGRSGESIINSLMLQEQGFMVDDRCVKFVWEMENYVLDEQGRYPRTHDHLIDCLFYLVAASRLELGPTADRDREAAVKAITDGKIRSPQDYREFEKKKGQLGEVEDSFYDYDSMEDLWMN